MGSRVSERGGGVTGARRRLGPDERGFSESFAVVVLVGLTVLMAISAGFYVVTVDTDESDEETPEFSYDYSSEDDSLFVQYVDGPTYPADSVVVESNLNQVSWTELAGMDVNGTLEPGAGVRLNAQSDWGEPVAGVNTIAIYHEGNDSREELSNWTAD